MQQPPTRNNGRNILADLLDSITELMLDINDVADIYTHFFWLRSSHAWNRSMHIPICVVVCHLYMLVFNTKM